MKYSTILLVMLFAFSSGSIATEIPAIVLANGQNEVALSIENGWNRDISGITVSPGALPSWLTVQEEILPVPVEKNHAGSETMLLKFSVSGALPGAWADVPLTLKDDKGNCWALALTVTVAGKAEPRPEIIDALYDNFPNPFNPATTITYSIKSNGHTNLTIYNTLGQMVRTLVDTPQPAGVHKVQWNGCDEEGRQVASGVYFYRLNAGSFTQTRRMLLVE